MLAQLLLVSMTSPTLPGLAGVWTAHHDYGPALAGGTVIVQRSPAWTAAVGGMQAAAAAGNAARFVFKDGSELRVRLTPRMEGQWIQPGNEENGERIATPVTVHTAGWDRWTATLHPLPDVQHLTLYVVRSPAGTLQAFLRNPERNAGARLGIRTVAVTGSALRLRADGQSDITGAFNQDADTIELTDPGLPGRFVFRRAAAPPPNDGASEAPVTNGDGWQTSTLRAAGIDAAAIDAIAAGIRAQAPGPQAPYVQALLIARHGKLVFDEYFNGFDASRPHDVRSAGKSVTALLVGRAIADTHALSTNTRLTSILSEYAPFAHDDAAKQRIDVGNLLSMSAGYACDDNDDASPGNEDTMQTQQRQPDWYKYTLDLPMLFAPGSSALYCSAQINLLGAVITKATHAWLPDYFYDRFAAPMQFGSYGMWLTPPPLTTAYMAGGDSFRPRDFLKFGELFLRGGRWNGREILDPHWLAQCAAQHSFIQNNGPYGYGWHLLDYTIAGHTIRAVNAGGNGGQLLYVFPQLDMTVMIAAANYGQFPVWRRFGTGLVPRILQAVK